MQYKLSIGCNKSNLLKIRNFVSEALEGIHLKEVESYKIVLAVDEVCANMMIHSNQCNPTKKIDIQIDLRPTEKIVFIIKDRGIQFDIKEYSEPSIDEIGF